MAELRQTDEHAHETGIAAEATQRSALKRRGLIAGAAALVAGVLAKQASDPVAAGTDGDVVLNSGNNATATTSISASLTNTPGIAVLNNWTAGTDGHSDGIQGYATGSTNAAVFGRSSNGVGLHGESTTGTAVYGNATTGYSVGVTGQSNYIGIYGICTTASGYGVYGTSVASGVVGTTTGANTGTAGVYGIASVNGTIGVLGSVGAGVAAHAIVGTASAAQYAGVYGQTGTAGAFGVYGVAPAGATAGYFSGKVTVAGDFSVTGSKSAAVAHPDGTHRLLYCVEAPEAWFEDFGEGMLTNGTADVTLDPEFAAVVDTRQMHVFFTETGEHHALFLTAKHAAGFTVQADAAVLKAKGKSLAEANTRFSYRVVARRKDNPGVRLAKVTLDKPVAAKVAEQPVPKVTPPPARPLRTP